MTIYYYYIIIVLTLINEPSSEFTPSLSQPLPKVSKDIKIEINADLKGIFAPQTSNGNIFFGKFEALIVYSIFISSLSVL